MDDQDWWRHFRWYFECTAAFWLAVRRCWLKGSYFSCYFRSKRWWFWTGSCFWRTGNCGRFWKRVGSLICALMSLILKPHPEWSESFGPIAAKVANELPVLLTNEEFGLICLFLNDYECGKNNVRAEGLMKAHYGRRWLVVIFCPFSNTEFCRKRNWN